MTSHEFNQIFNNRIDQIKNVLQFKADHYADDNDRLHNFKAAASLRDTNAIDALNGMMAKHIVSIQDMLNKFNGVSEMDYGALPTQKWVDEKIGDTINYLILLESVLTELRNEITDVEYEVNYNKSQIQNKTK